MTLFIEKMSLANLKKALEDRNLPTSGPKCDLRMRLEEEFRREGKDPANFFLNTEEISGRTICQLCFNS
jgi:hypothetical protein